MQASVGSQISSKHMMAEETPAAYVHPAQEATAIELADGSALAGPASQHQRSSSAASLPVLNEVREKTLHSTPRSSHALARPWGVLEIASAYHRTDITMLSWHCKPYRYLTAMKVQPRRPVLCKGSLLETSSAACPSIAAARFTLTRQGVRAAPAMLARIPDRA